MNANMKPRIIILLAILILICTITPTSAWLTDYWYRQNITVSYDTDWDNDLTNYPVLFIVDTSSGSSSSNTIYTNGNSQADIDDVVFTDSSDNPLPYWIESSSTSSPYNVWVNVNSISNTSETTLYVYYGNAGASNTSSGYDTFTFFDDFSGTALNGTAWHEYTEGTSTVTVTGGSVDLYCQGDTGTKYAAIVSNISIPMPYVMESRIKHDNAADFYYHKYGESWTEADPGAGGYVQMLIYQRMDASTPNVNYYVNGTAQATTNKANGNWYRSSLYMDEDFYSSKLDNTFYNVTVSQFNYIETYPAYNQIRSADAGDNFNTYVDWMAIRTHATPDPYIISVDSEETSVPTAEFSGTPLLGGIPLLVTFTDLSTGSPTGWSWNFGDGNTSILQNPTHTYSTPGTYTVILNASNAAGYNIETKVGYVGAYCDPGDYSYNLTMVLHGSDINLTNYEVPITVSRTSGTSAGNTLYVNTAVGSDYADIKFWQDGSICDYWIESGYTSTSATIWVEVPSILADGYGTSYLYALFGNGDDIDIANGTNTFMFFDDFESGVLWNYTGGKWNYESGSCENWTITDSTVYDGSYAAQGKNWGYQDNDGRILKYRTWHYNFTLGNWEQLQTDLRNVTIESRMRWTSTGTSTCHGGVLYSNIWNGVGGTSGVYSPYYIMEYGHIVHYDDSSFQAWDYSWGNYTVNTWHKVKYTRDFVNQNQSAWIDGHYLGSEPTEVADGNNIDDTWRVYWTGVIAASTYANPDPDPQYTYIDDYFVHQFREPEPYVSSVYVGSTGPTGFSPTAAFSANITSGVEPLAVQFTDESVTSGTISSWLWDFNNDGVTDSTSQNPVCNYTTAGTYTVNLTITDEYGTDSEIKVDYISVSSSLYPDAQFSANITYGVAPLAVQFTDLSTNTPSSWKWNFTTGGATVDSTSQNPVYTYSSPGTYTVNLTAGNAFGSDTIIKLGYITVVNQSASTGSGAYYATHDVRFTVKQLNGICVPNVYVTAIPTNTTYGSWTWITDLLGLSESVDIKNATLAGWTGQDGAIAFMMIPEIEYQMQFYNSTNSIDTTIKIYPKDNDYIIYVTGTSDVNLTPMSSCINWSKYYGEIGGTATVGMLFTDECGTTSNISVLAYYSNGTYTSGAFNAAPGTSEVNLSTSFAYSSGDEFKWAIVVNSTYGNYTYWNLYTPPITPITTDVPAWALKWGAVGFMLLLAAIFSFTSVKFGAIVLPIFAGVFTYMGWITTPAGVISFLLSIGVLYYIRHQERFVT